MTSKWRKRLSLSFSVVCVVALAFLGLAGSAFGADLARVYDQATGTRQPTYDRTAESTPTYNVDDSTWQSLNRESSDLASDTTIDAEEANAAAEEVDVNECFKAGLWGMVFDAGWDAVNGYSFDIGNELSTMSTRLVGCLTEKAGLPNVTASRLSDFLMESFKSRALAALQVDPNTKAFLDWVAVTAWYSIG